MAATTFRCRLITPDAVVLDEPVVGAIVPAWDGLLGVLPNRAPIVAQLGSGELRLDFADKGGAKGGSRAFFVDDGFVQMVENQLTILAAKAIAAEQLSESDAQTELNALNAKPTEGLPPAAAERLSSDKRRAQAKVRTAKSFKSRGAI